MQTRRPGLERARHPAHLHDQLRPGAFPQILAVQMRITASQNWTAQTFFTLEEDCKTIMEHSRIWQPVASETRPHDESDHQYQMILEQMVENCDAEEYNAQTGEWTATAEIVRHSPPASVSPPASGFSLAPPRAGRRALREKLL